MFADLIGHELVAAQAPAHFGAYQHRLNARQNLTYQEANRYMRMVLELDDPRQRSAQLGVLLNSFMAKHATVEEATGVIDAALALDTRRPADRPHHPFTGEQVIGMAGSGKKGFKNTKYLYAGRDRCRRLGRHVVGRGIGGHPKEPRRASDRRCQPDPGRHGPLPIS